MKFIQLFFVFLFTSSLISSSSAQSTSVSLAVENVELVGTDVLFDIYLQSSSTDGSSVFLSGSDFVLSFNPAAFQNPTFSRVANPSPPEFNGLVLQNGYCTLVPTNADGALNDWFLQKEYYDGSSTTTLNGDRLIINLNAPLSTSQSNLDNKIAAIDATPNQHRLGRFSLGGYAGGLVNLNWYIEQPGISTLIYSYENTPPFASDEIPVLGNQPEEVGINTANEEQNLSLEVRINNPVQNQIHLSIDALPQGGLTYELYDDLGRLLQMNSITHLSSLINVERYPTGLLFLRLLDEDGRQMTKKLLKME